MSRNDHRPQNKNMPSAYDVVQALFENSKSPLAPGFKMLCLERDWHLVVGKKIAENSRPVNLDRHTLLVEVKHSVWSQELIYQEEVMCKQINTYLGEQKVSHIRFLVGKAKQPTR